MSQDRWWTESGWATKGSKLQTQLYVNERPQELSAAVCEALPSLAGGGKGVILAEDAREPSTA